MPAREVVTPRTPAFDAAYPRALWEQERRYLPARGRRDLSDDRPPADTVGVALSGGGIRSATFCLGAFQALARLGLIGRIDYLSTVSGGGYFGSFFCRLFRYPGVGGPEDVEAMLDRDGPGRPQGRREGPFPDVIRWLRENGRYLSPNGAGDLLLALAILLRNWVAVQVVVLSLVLLVFVTVQWLRVWAERVVAATATGVPCLPRAPTGPVWLWCSPFLLLPLVMLVLWAAPFGWAYWLVERRDRLARQEGGTGPAGGRTSAAPWYADPLWGVAAAAAAGIGVVGAAVTGHARGFAPGPLLGAGVVVVVTAALTFGCWWRAGAAAASRADAAGDLPAAERLVFLLDEQRNWLSQWLKTALFATAGTLAFALVDSVGQTLYVASLQPDSTLLTVMGTIVSGLAGVAAFGKRIAVALGERSDGHRLGLPRAALVTALAILVIAVVLVMVNVLAHGVAWAFRAPAEAPYLTWIGVTRRDGPRDAAALALLGAACVVLAVFARLFAISWPFLNRSSLQSMYGARLTRAFLGASNPERNRPGGSAVTRVLPGDNIAPSAYWADPAPAPGGGATPPIHLINVTINETVDGRSQVQMQDRKGTGLALGPCAFSVGIRHHAVFPSHAVLRRGDDPRVPAIFPGSEGEDGAFQVFRLPSEDDRRGGSAWRGGEPLALGTWVGISGAAFSTGLGARTSLGLSLLCGFGNVRLGYWWDSGLPRVQPPGRRRGPLYWLEEYLAVQTYFLSEFVSRFYGTSRRRWYLSDGGHFENMGGYELIRRRLPRILLLDAEADPDYTFEGLANLVRKARIDFGAEITFLTGEELNRAVAASHRPLFGTLEQIRRGRWQEEPAEEPLTRRARRSIEEPVDESRYSLAHAALARIAYEDGSEGWMVYLKPTLTGDEPADLIQYHRMHPSFPQETTGDQFFDEAQWESYRMLGFQIALDVLAAGIPAPGPRDPGAYRIPREILFG